MSAVSGLVGRSAGLHSHPGLWCSSRSSAPWPVGKRACLLDCGTRAAAAGSVHLPLHLAELLLTPSSLFNLPAHMPAASAFRVAGGPASVDIPVTMNEMLLRGCMLKNSKAIAGLVVYTGKETRIQMNAAKTPLKVGECHRRVRAQRLWRLCRLKRVGHAAALQAPSQ